MCFWEIKQKYNFQKRIICGYSSDEIKSQIRPILKRIRFYGTQIIISSEVMLGHGIL